MKFKFSCFFLVVMGCKKSLLFLFFENIMIFINFFVVKYDDNWSFNFCYGIYIFVLGLIDNLF